MRIAIIPARGNSRRVPRKNVREFMGMPMLMYPIKCATASRLFDLVVVSTDDPDIAAVAFCCGAIVMPRPQDDGCTGTQEIAARVLDRLDADGLACVIYPCTPLLFPEDLVGARRQLVNHGRPFVYSVGPNGKDAGAFYWGASHCFRARVPLSEGDTYTLPADRVCDIDTPEDWARAESMFEALRSKS